MPINHRGGNVSSAEMFASIEYLTRSLEEYGAQYLREAATSVTQELVNNTPVQTGFAKNNWKVSVGVPDLSLQGSESEAEQARKDINAGTRGTGTLYQERDHAVRLLTYKLVQGSIYITNNTPYIAQLVDDHPSGDWAQDAVDSGLAYTDTNSG